MVGAGTAMAAVGALAGLLAWRRRKSGAALPRPVLLALVGASPLGFVALEAGWLVTEWGRQPWVVRGFLRTADAVTSFPYKAAPFWLFTVVYVFLGASVAYLLARQIVGAHRASAPGAAEVERAH
jgi:cytochrome d ubiquinol oxidase subunit I